MQYKRIENILPQHATAMTPFNTFFVICCGFILGCTSGLVGYPLTMRIMIVRRNAVLHGWSPPSVIRLIPGEFGEMTKAMLLFLTDTFALIMDAVYVILRRLRSKLLRSPFWPRSRSEDLEETLPISTPYLQDAGMRSGSTRDFRPGLPSNNQHLLESRRPSSEVTRAAPVPTDYVDSLAPVRPNDFEDQLPECDNLALFERACCGFIQCSETSRHSIGTFSGRHSPIRPANSRGRQHSL